MESQQSSSEQIPQNSDRKSNEPYENFDISIGRRGPDGHYPVSAKSAYGEVQDAIWQELPIEDLEFNDLLAYLSDLIAKPEEGELMGGIIRDFLFPPKIWDLYNRSRTEAVVEGKEGLRLRLRISPQSPELHRGIPWEYCKDDKSFMALNAATPIVRFNPFDHPPKPFSLRETPRILVACASPTDQAPLDMEFKERMFRETLDNLIKTKRLEMKVIQHATPRALRREFRRFKPHVLHFVGHGYESDDKYTLVLEDEDGLSRPIDANNMWVLLQNSDVKLLFLDACDSATIGSHLVNLGIPAVIAMQFKIPEKTSIAFQHDFYEFLADGKPLDTAVTEARIGTYFDYDDKLFWAIPILLTSAADGVIWHLKTTGTNKPPINRDLSSPFKLVGQEQTSSSDIESSQAVQVKTTIKEEEKEFTTDSQQTILVNLRKKLRTLFDEGELRDLCFDLSVDYEELSGDNKHDKARELVTYMQRRNKLQQLADTIHKLRPHSFE